MPYFKIQEKELDVCGSPFHSTENEKQPISITCSSYLRDSLSSHLLGLLW